VTNINDPWLSDFERKELLREETGELPWWHDESEWGTQLFRTQQRLEDHPEWVLTATFDIGRSDFRLVGIAIDPASLSPPLQGLTIDVIRSIRVTPLYETARGWLTLPETVGPAFDIDKDTFGAVRRTGRRGRDDLFYARWASCYVDEVAKGPAPLARLHRREHLDESTIRGFLQEARRRRLLTKAPQGKAGGKLTEKAKRLLEMEERKG
jgi:hypothetical protein